MKSINKVTLIGAVGKDPETRYTASGMAVTTFSLATSTKQKDKDEVTQWHSCVTFGKLAEIIHNHVTKGTKLYVDGAIQYQCVDKDGEKRYYTKIIANDISMLSQGSVADNGTDSATHGKQTASGSGTTRAKTQTEQFDDSDIPF